MSNFPFLAKVKMRTEGESVSPTAGSHTSFFAEACANMYAGQTASRFYLGLSLGPASEFSALAVLQLLGRERTDEPLVFHCRHLRRWPVRTPYAEIVADVLSAVKSPELKVVGRPTVALDLTGVGAPVFELFKRGRLPARLDPFVVSGGDSVTEENGVTRVPKRDLVSAGQVALQDGRLKIASGLEEADTLARELQSFRVKVTLDAGGDAGAWRVGAHDDLVYAVLLALWAGEHRQPARFKEW